jgi:hypothetical protein
MNDRGRRKCIDIFHEPSFDPARKWGNGGDFPNKSIVVVKRPIESRDINAFDVVQGLEPIFSTGPRLVCSPIPLHEFQKDFFAFAEEKYVDKVGQGLRVEKSGDPSSHDEGLLGRPFRRVERNPCEIEDRQEMNKIILKGDRKGQYLKIL